LLVPGGTYYRSYNGVDFTDKSYPATVADFYLDKYEITVGRFRQFVNDDGWIMHQVGSRRLPIVATVGKQAARMANWRKIGCRPGVW
jgi:formylglycine-generating enzyme required for sulfatase activity